MDPFVHRIFRIWVVLLLALSASTVRTPLTSLQGTDHQTGPATVMAAPAALHLLSDVASIAAGEAHTCAVVSGGLKCWGINSDGQLGDGTKNNQKMPVDVTGLTGGVSASTAGARHTCALTTGGGVKCWGDNHGGQLGDGTTVPHITPANVSGLTNGVQSIDAGRYHNCAVTNSGGVVCWGNNVDGEMGDGTSGNNRLIPVSASGLTSGMTGIAAGWYHSLALTSGSGVRSWGDNFDGQLGMGTAGNNQLIPVDVSGLTSGAAKIAGGGYHTCALTTGGGVKCWGRNSYGQLGDGFTTNRNAPVDVSGLSSGINAIATGAYHSCALTGAGRVKCWGNNQFGQLGDGTKTNRLTPVEIPNLSGVSAITAGDYHTCAITSTHEMKCWGANGSGQLGDGTTTDRSSPVDVILPNHAPVISEGTAIPLYVSEKRDDKSNNQENYMISQVLHAADQDNDPLTWSVSTSALHGAATVSETNTSATIRYTPYTGYIGSDSFVVQVSDGDYGGVDTITVNVKIQPPLFLPGALNQFSGCFGGPLEIEPNNTFSEANGPLCLGRVYQGYPNDQKDDFYFVIDTARDINVILNSHTGKGVQLQLYYENTDNLVEWDPTPPYSLSVPTARPGRYYIFIYTSSGFNTTSLYSLTVNP